jgi:hypothetical protein
MDSDLLGEVDTARGRVSRSQFIREAIAEKLRAMGVSVPEDIVYPPDRAGNVAKVVGNKNTVNQVFKSASVLARKPVEGRKGKRGKAKPEK